MAMELRRSSSFFARSGHKSSRRPALDPASRRRLADPIWIEDPYRQCRLTPLTSPASPALLDLTEEGQSRGMAGSMQAFFQKKHVLHRSLIQMVLAKANLASSCFMKWMQYTGYTRSQSCPFCRGSVKRVQSRDLLTGDDDVIDPVTLEKENVRHFQSFIDSLPLIVPDNLLLVYYDYLHLMEICIFNFNIDV
ncbi:hypothetical protein ZWY2020_030472 [Hordeum vulgare]|nr:hypothetical protein ZWY2020_030472 [Hordeum vulgare]